MARPARYACSVQILEDSMLGLRTARMLFRHRDRPASVTLFPMVHVGEQAFYEATHTDAFSHDVTLVEGVKSPVVRHLTRSYRWIDFRRLGLVLQPKAPPQGEVASRIVHADLSTDEFHREWRRLPRLLRATIFLLAPWIGLRRRFAASRETLAHKMSLEDRRSSEEVLRWSVTTERLDRSIIEARDRRLLECLAAELDGAERRIAIVYGARHMRAVIRDLTGRGFYCAESRWQTIFAL